MRPPSGVNLIAFESKFRMTCLTFRSSALHNSARPEACIRLAV